MLLNREENEPTHLKISVGIKALSAFLILILGFFGHEIHALALLALILGVLLIPITYGAYVWYQKSVVELNSDA